MARGKAFDRFSDRFTFGGRVDGSVGMLLVMTLAASLLVAFTSRHVESPVRAIVALEPNEVMRGQVWRLFSWSFIEPEPIGLVVACYVLWTFGGALAADWGTRRFLSVWLGIAGVSGILTCLVALVDAHVGAFRHLGGEAMMAALLVGWGLWFPDRILRLFFVLPVRGVWIAWGTIALSVVFAIYRGWEGFVPELAAEATMLAWLFRADLVRKWRAAQRERGLRAAAVERQERASKRAAVAAHLREVESQEGDDEPPPLPPEIEEQLGRLFGKVDHGAPSTRGTKRRPED